MDRRDFLRGLGAVALLDLAARRGAAAPAADEALARFDAGVRALRRGETELAAWHAAVADVAGALEPGAVSAWIDLEQLKRKLPLPSSRFGSRKIRLPRSPRLQRAGFDTFLFGFQAGTAIPPHGHTNVAALLFVLEGEVHARHYDRVETRDDALVLKPTIDRALKPAGATWVSDAKDNVHWFQAHQRTWALDLAVPDVRPRPGKARRRRPSQRLTFLDMENARETERGLEAPVMSMPAAMKRYGAFSG
jgi:hypothetical protein